MRAVVMAGGEGTRLRPLTCGRPKPLLRVANVPVLSHVIDLLRRHGFDEVLVTVRYLWRQIAEEVGERQDSVLVRYCREESPLGTAGSVRGAVGTGEPVLVVSGDALTDFDLGELIRRHRDCGAVVSIALGRVPDPTRFGVVVTDGDGRVTEFLEKPPPGQATTDLINTGIYVVEPPALTLIPEGEPHDFARDLFPRLLDQGISLFGHELPGYWCDIGDADQYLSANIDACGGRVRLASRPRIADGARVALGARVTPDTMVGLGAVIESGAVVGPCTTVGPGVVIGVGARVAWSTLGAGSVIGPGADVNRAAIGDGSRIGAEVRIGEGAVVGDRTRIGDEAVVRPRVRIWPDKQVSSGDKVSRDIVWGSGFRRATPVAGVVEGLTGLELGPQAVAELAGEVASGVGTGQSLAIGCADGAVAGAMKLAALAGAAGGGVRAVDCGTLTRPGLALSIRALGAAGGLYISTRGAGDRRLRVDILGADGRPSGQSEGWGARASFDRVVPAAPRDYLLPDRFNESVDLHRRRLLASVDGDRIRRRRWRGVIACERDASALMMVSLCDKLGLEPIGGVSCISRDHALRALARYGTQSGSEFAAMVTGDGTGLLLAVAGNLSGRDELIVLLTRLLLKAGPPGDILFLPPDASRHCDRLAGDVGVVIHRVAWPPPDRLEARLWADGAAQLLLILDAAAEMGIDLADLGAPRPAFHREAVWCPWDERARVLRELAVGAEKVTPSTAGGLHYADDRGWAYIVPDPRSARLLIACEAGSVELAAELSGDVRAAIEMSVKRGGD